MSARTTIPFQIRIQEALYAAIKARAESQGMTMAELVRMALREAVWGRPTTTGSGELGKTYRTINDDVRMQ